MLELTTIITSEDLGLLTVTAIYDSYDNEGEFDDINVTMQTSCTFNYTNLSESDQEKVIEALNIALKEWIEDQEDPRI